MSVPVRQCVVCEESIDHLRSSATACSARCRAEASRRRRGVAAKRTAVSCQRCGGEITGRRADAAYCGDECKRLAARDRAESRVTDGSPAETATAEIQGAGLAAQRANALRAMAGAR